MTKQWLILFVCGSVLALSPEPCSTLIAIIATTACNHRLRSACKMEAMNTTATSCGEELIAK